MTGLEEFVSLTEEEAIEYNKGGEKHKVRDVIAGHIKKVGGNVLDAGCGRGIDAHRYKKEDYVGVDISPMLIKVAKENNPGYIFMVADLQNLPFMDKTFDNVFCKSVLEHQHSEEQVINAFKEMIRVCKNQLLVAWHTVPIHGKTKIWKYKGQFNKDWYTNTYDLELFEKLVPKIEVEKVVEMIDNETLTFTLWVIECY